MISIVLECASVRNVRARRDGSENIFSICRALSEYRNRNSVSHVSVIFPGHLHL